MGGLLARLVAFRGTLLWALGSFCGLSGRYWPVFGALLARLGVPLAAFGPLSAVLRLLLAALDAVLEPSWRVLGAILASDMLIFYWFFELFLKNHVFQTVSLPKPSWSPTWGGLGWCHWWQRGWRHWHRHGQRHGHARVGAVHAQDIVDGMAHGPGLFRWIRLAICVSDCPLHA